MRGSRAFDAYVRVCDTGEPWVHEVTYDTPFGDGYMLGTFVQRSAKLGDGLVNFLTDVTAQRRMEERTQELAAINNMKASYARAETLARASNHSEEPADKQSDKGEDQHNQDHRDGKELMLIVKCPSLSLLNGIGKGHGERRSATAVRAVLAKASATGNVIESATGANDSLKRD